MKKQSISDTKRIVLFTIIIILVVSIIGILSYFVLRERNSKTPEDLKKNSQEIVGYGITIDDLDTTLYRDEFNKLKANLEGGNINYDEYAESVAKMFVIDLYTIKNKINKYDIGGVEFVLPEGRDNYITNVTDTIYNYVEDNSNGKRKQQLPVVNSVEIQEVKKDKYKVTSLDKTYDAYIFNINIGYSLNLGYDETAEVTIVNKDNFMYVVEKN